MIYVLCSVHSVTFWKHISYIISSVAKLNVSTELMALVFTYKFKYFKLLPPAIRSLFRLVESHWQRTMQWHIRITYLLLNDYNYAILFFIFLLLFMASFNHIFRENIEAPSKNRLKWKDSLLIRNHDGWLTDQIIKLKVKDLNASDTSATLMICRDSFH